jgi:hypothetical protein
MKTAWLAALLFVGATACSGSSTPVDGGTDDTVADVPAEVPGEVADDAPGEVADALDAAELPPPALWEGTEPWVPDGSVPADHPAAFARVSRYHTHVSGPVEGRPDVGHRGSFGVGNGRVFGFVGLADPLNTLHTLVGPTYEKKDERFFGDYAIFLGDPGAAFDEEWAGRSLSAPVAFTRGRKGDIDVDTFDAAPLAGTYADTCFLRMIRVRNRGATEATGLKLSIVASGPDVVPNVSFLVETAGPRKLYTRLWEGAVPEGKKTLVHSLPAIPAGGESAATLAHCASDHAITDFGDFAVPDTGDHLDALAEAYGPWDAGLLGVDLPDPLVADFIDGMKMTLKVQTAASGATCPMSEYTRTWARDNIGPVMAMLDLGGFEDVEAMLDYVYAAIRHKGDLQNSYDADLDVAAAPPAPDWDAMPPLGAKVAAETPSYMVTMYGLHHRFTGDASRAAERWGLLRRCLTRQGFGVDDLLPFTGDETYREAMNAAAGMTVLDYPHHELSWSANSSALWLGAEREYARLAVATGHAADGEAAAAKRPGVEKGALDHYLLPDGCLSPYVDKATMQAAPAPFEDVALQVTWSGWKDGDDPLARSTLECLLQRLGTAPGMVQSPASPDYPLYSLIEGRVGIYTGMLPGYTLAALADSGHPEALDAFNAVRLSIDTSGNLQEYMIYGDHSGLSLVYDANGGLGDYTAKFRPWEGGIVLDAVMRYLVGFRPDAVARTLSLRPHLPNDWPFARYTGLRAGSGRFDLSIERVAGGGVALRLASRADEDWQVDVRWDAPAASPPAFEADGASIAEADVTRLGHFGAVSARTPALTLPARGELVLGIR